MPALSITMTRKPSSRRPSAIDTPAMPAPITTTSVAVPSAADNGSSGGVGGTLRRQIGSDSRVMESGRFDVDGAGEVRRRSGNDGALWHDIDADVLRAGS